MTRPWNPAVPEVPVDKDGNWIDYPGYGQHSWVTIHTPFWAVMEVDGMRTGRSSKKVILKDLKTGLYHPMFVVDLMDGIRKGALDVRSVDGEGYLTANWTGSKRGSNYGIKAVIV